MWRGVAGVAAEVALAVGVYMIYRFGRMLTQDAVESARHNAGLVVELERSLGLFTERTFQRWVLEVDGAVPFLNRYYIAAHFTGAVAFLIWVFVRRRRAYPPIRSWFAMVTLSGLVIHVLFPLAPPRMSPGFVDTLREFGPNIIYTDDPSRSIANQFAAMPSLHFGWALLVAIAMTRLAPRWRFVWFLHPTFTLLAIVGTGNHYWLDAIVAGALVVALGVPFLRDPRLRRPPVSRRASNGADARSGEPVPVVASRGQRRPQVGSHAADGVP